jgi:recombinational DNA repair protein (RecF pathway)
MYTLKDAVLIDAFDHIKKDLNVMKEAAFVLELIDKCLIDQEHDRHIFSLLINTLTQGSLLENILRFTLHMLASLGYDLPLEADGRNIKGFNISQARIVYQDEDTFCDIDIEDLVWLLKLKHTKYDIILGIPNMTYQRLKQYLKSFILYHIHTTITN